MKNYIEAYSKVTNSFLYREYIKKRKNSQWSKILSNSFKNITEKNIKNFRNNEMGPGFDNNFLIDKEKIKKDFEKYKNDNILLQNLDLLPNIKNNYGNLKNFINFKDKMIEYDTFSNLSFYNLIDKFILKKNRINLICEIGGGYGWLTRIIKTRYPDIKFVLIDLPELNLISNYYLKSNFQKLNFLNFSSMNSEKITKENLQQNDFIIAPPFVDISDLSIDLFINRHSMMEMLKQDIKLYFDLIQNNKKKDFFFINQNRYYQDYTFKNYLYKYPYDKNWAVVFSDPKNDTRRMHLLITKRSNDHDKNKEFQNEIKIIKNLTLQQSPQRFVPLFLIRLIRKFKAIIK